MRVGVFGGAFNPIHNHHLVIAQCALEECGLNEVMFVPTYRPVHKPSDSLLDYESRCSMVERAIFGHPGFSVSRVEKELGGPSFTINLVEHLMKRTPGALYFLLIGEDSLVDLPNWGRSSELISLASFVIIARPGTLSDGRVPNNRSFFLSRPVSRVSSSSIRERISRGAMKGLEIPPSVAADIAFFGHYNSLSSPFNKWIQSLRNKSEKLKPKIEGHMQSVARLAAEYCAQLGEDPRFGLVAGYAHDLFRLAPDSEIQEQLKNTKLKLTRVEKSDPMLAHGAAAAEFLRALEPKVPQKVLTAVRNHTFPGLRRGPIGKALVLADTLDPFRGKPERDRKRLENKSLDEKYRDIVFMKRSKHSSDCKVGSKSV